MGFYAKQFPDTIEIKEIDEWVFKVDNKYIAIALIDSITTSYVEDYIGSGGVFILYKIVLKSDNNITFSYDINAYTLNGQAVDTIKAEQYKDRLDSYLQPIVNKWVEYINK